MPFVEHDQAAALEVWADVSEDRHGGGVQVTVDVDEADRSGRLPAGQGVSEQSDDELCAANVGWVAGELACVEPAAPVLGEPVERVEPDGGHGGGDECEGAASGYAELEGDAGRVECEDVAEEAVVGVRQAWAEVHVTYPRAWLSPGIHWQT